MKSSIKIALIILAVTGFGSLLGPSIQPSAASYDMQVLSKMLPVLKLGNRHSSPVIQHGTHLCSAPSHCGTGHLCCSGHCKAVSTCG